MKRSRGRGTRADVGSLIDANDDSAAFIHLKLLIYMERLIRKGIKLTQEVCDFLFNLLNPVLSARLLDAMMEQMPEDKLEQSDEERGLGDSWEFSNLCSEIFRRMNADQRHRFDSSLMDILEVRRRELTRQSSTHLENNLQSFQKMFGLNEIEVELCLFLFIISTWGEANFLFEDHLECTVYTGRKRLATALGCSESNLVEAIGGKLHQIGILDTDTFRTGLELKHEFARKLQNLSPEEFRNQFIRKMNCDLIPLEDHMMDPELTDSILRLLSCRPKTSTHILLYGPPGTGKTTYAYGVARKLGMDCYQMDLSSKDESSSRRAAITACVNMASETENALFIADDMDLILNTRRSWSFFGETPDKPWLHDILERPGVRMIWTVNTTENIEESVARRLSMSVRFKSFSTNQRINLWNSIIRKHDVKRFFSDCEISNLAGRFPVSAGVIDQAVRKAIESGICNSGEFKRLVTLALESNLALSNGGRLKDAFQTDNHNFSIHGLSLSGTDTQSLLNELKAFEEYSRKNRSLGSLSMSLLFHGAPGTGKSALARYVATHLEKEVVFKRASDLFSKWVGETEQNIRMAYEEAQSQDAVLIFDEADSLIFGRDRAQHSWELSLTNEFLTWMESFNGIQIFTTNRIRDLDSASLRRFSHKIEFGYLKPDGNAIFYKSYLAPLVTGKPDGSVNQRLSKMDNLAPGDFKSVRDRFRFRNSKSISHDALLSALEEESRLKSIHSGSSRIGF